MQSGKHIGIVGVSAEGAALCYRTICAEGAELFGRHAHPQITMHTFPLSDYMISIERGEWQEAAGMVLSSARILQGAGADFLICPDNTAHQAIDLIREELSIPWLHIAEEVAAVAASHGFRRLLILGTRYLMEGPVYPSKLAARGIDLVIPPPEVRKGINDAIFDELVYGRFESTTRSQFVQIIEEYGRGGCDAVVLGCTEIPLLISDRDSALPTLDSTRILARAALRKASAINA